MFLDQGFGNRQPEPSSTLRPSIGGVQLLELAEQSVHLTFRNSRTVIFDLKTHSTICATNDTNIKFSFGSGKFDCVGNQIRQNLHNSVMIALGAVGVALIPSKNGGLWMYDDLSFHAYESLFETGTLFHISLPVNTLPYCLRN